MENTLNTKEENPAYASRRNFLKISGLTLAGTGLLLAGCNNDDDGGSGPSNNQLPGIRNGVFDLGGGDFGVLTYAYALEQLEADFYTRVVTNASFASFSEEAKDILSDLHKHEVIHREFFKAALTDALPNPTAQLLPPLAFTYGNLNFGNQAAVIDTAIALEDTGVAAYNGAGRLITNPDYLVIAGQIVSVEARHAAAVRDLRNPGSTDFANTADANGLDPAKKPSEIATVAQQFITTQFTATFLP
ncbi:ferritin-like domain-containing protein [Flavobacterium selenitireducens]|uniref:ferritin-like domain-containing protein n=1 Tax=Flavobacterium selenitireducens TaxID=2722704 RepID=UPI00168B2D77|nr:ferritin-like domain-containing protein [Flavobacterium selenitireducens]MBD3582343.1 ferritin-like domain-containing protein [Flavobacterium selenitireducens]